MIKEYISIVSLFLAFSISLQAQEFLLPLEINPVKTGQRTKTKTADKDAVASLLLPFVEDFSYPGPYPDPALWVDSFAYVNPGFAIHPKTIGSATFDALNQYGEVYEHASSSLFQFSADKLTSQPIRLDSVFDPVPMALNPADSIILSFYFQPQGKGSAPRDRDSLVLEFLHTPGYYIEDPENPDEEIWIDDLWVSFWRSEGTTLQEFLAENDSTYFQRVAIHIEDGVYFRNDFQFRFRNYASFPLTKTPNNYAGNTNIWNVDYITLDYGRSAGDIFYYDIAFAAPAQSMLRKFQSMPWSHYIVNPQAHLRNRFNVLITNLDNTTYNYTYRYFIEDEDGNRKNYTGGTWNIAPFHIQGYQTYEQHANPLLIPNPLPTDPAPARQFTIKHIIREGSQGDDLQRNDTIRFHQIFDNYFAYDDGIPESGYGLIGNNARGAVRFVLGHTDTLDAVKFYFNPTVNNQNQKPFYLKIWKKLDPPEILYESEVLNTEFASGINRFVTYELNPPILVSDTIYVGWKQISNDFLNIGFDRNNNAGGEIFFNTFGEWLPTIFEGALMIRPVFGQALITYTPEFEERKQVNVYPNPVRGQRIMIDHPFNNIRNSEIRIFDATGRMVYSGQFEKETDVSSLANGMYLLQIINQGQSETITSRFIIAR